MRPVLPVLALAALTALPAAAAGHRHARGSHAVHAAGSGRAGSTRRLAGPPSALATPYDYGTDARSAKGGVGVMMAGGKTAKGSQNDLAGLTGISNFGAAKKHSKIQVLPAY